MQILDHRHGQPGERIAKRRVVRDNGDDRLKTGIEETARGFSDKQLTAERLQQLLTTEAGR
jgi:hypothetical protein